MRHVPELDGLRAFAVLAVVALHAGKLPLGNGGYVGVDIFFVLSGYLITSLLVCESASTGKIAVGRFYLRRLFRLMPALALLICTYLLFAPLIWPAHGVDRHLRDGLVSATYLSDYAYAIWKVPRYLRHTWSLAVEEHFYLLWPLILPAILRVRNPARLALLLYLIFACWRAMNFAVLDWTLAFYRFDTRLPGLLLGSWLALRLFERDDPAWSSESILPVSITVLLLVIVLLPWKATLEFQIALPLVELATVMLIAGVVQRDPSKPGIVRLVLRSDLMTWIGRLSYSVYLWHFPISLLTRKAFPYFISLVACLVSSLLFAWLSYHTVEAYGRALRKRLDVRVDAT